MPLSDLGAQNWVGVMFGLVAPPANFYVALCTDEPGAGWDGTVLATVEPADPAYARQAVAVPSGWTLGDNAYVFNAVEIAYPLPLLEWGIVTHYAVTDALTGGGLWFWDKFADAVSVPPGYDVALGIGSLSIALGDQLPSIAEI